MLFQLYMSDTLASTLYACLMPDDSCIELARTLWCLDLNNVARWELLPLAEAWSTPELNEFIDPSSTIHIF